MIDAPIIDAVDTSATPSANVKLKWTPASIWQEISDLSHFDASSPSRISSNLPSTVQNLPFSCFHFSQKRILDTLMSSASGLVHHQLPDHALAFRFPPSLSIFHGRHSNASSRYCCEKCYRPDPSPNLRPFLVFHPKPITKSPTALPPYALYPWKLCQHSLISLVFGLCTLPPRSLSDLLHRVLALTQPNALDY